MKAMTLEMQLLLPIDQAIPSNLESISGKQKKVASLHSSGSPSKVTPRSEKLLNERAAKIPPQPCEILIRS